MTTANQGPALPVIPPVIPLGIAPVPEQAGIPLDPAQAAQGPAWPDAQGNAIAPQGPTQPLPMAEAMGLPPVLNHKTFATLICDESRNPI